MVKNQISLSNCFFLTQIKRFHDCIFFKFDQVLPKMTRKMPAKWVPWKPYMVTMATVVVQEWNSENLHGG